MAQIKFFMLLCIGTCLLLREDSVGAMALPQEASREPLGPGVYLKMNDQYQEMEAEPLTWRAGSFSVKTEKDTSAEAEREMNIETERGTNSETKREVKAHLTGRTPGPRSRTGLQLPVEFLLAWPRGSPQLAFHVLRADAKKDRREFHLDFVWQQGIFISWSGTKDSEISVNVKEISREGLLVSVPLLSKGEYGILVSTGASGTGLPSWKI